MQIALTPKQQKVLQVIQDYQRQFGRSPTMQEMGDAIGVTKVTIHEHVSELVRKGVLLREAHRARSLIINPEVELPGPSSGQALPLLGAIAAGSPIEAIEDQQYVDLGEVFSPATAGGRQRFALQVRGDSMIEDHIADGDLVICERAGQARNGQTVVALTEEGDATLKRYYHEGDKVRLQPANSAMAPMFYAPHQVAIQGVLVGVVRNLCH